MNRTVLTGDIVSSKALSRESLDDLFVFMTQTANALAADQGASLRFSRNRGDGWQAVLHRPSRALRAALAFRATLRAKGQDSYIGAATGPVEDPLPSDLNAAAGQAFTDAATALSWTGHDDSESRMRVSGLGSEDAAFVLADHIARGWTEAQAAAIRPFLLPNPPTLEAAGAALGISRQAVTKARDAAGWRAVLQACLSIEVPADQPNQTKVKP